MVSDKGKDLEILRTKGKSEEYWNVKMSNRVSRGVDKDKVNQGNKKAKKRRKKWQKSRRGKGKKYEDYGFVLDFQSEGHPDEQKPPRFREPIAQILGENYLTLLEVVPHEDLLGENYLTLLEVVPHEDLQVSPQERVYIGKENREKIKRVKRRIGYNRLTSGAIEKLPVAIEKIVKSSQDSFVEFFNVAMPLGKEHELLAFEEIGEKRLWKILEARGERPFESFHDFNRVKGLTSDHIVEMIIHRIVKELKGVTDKYLFVRPTED